MVVVGRGEVPHHCHQTRGSLGVAVDVEDNINVFNDMSASTQSSDSSSHLSDGSNTVADPRGGLKEARCTPEQVLSWFYGFQGCGTYEHNKKYTDIMAMTYNGRMHQFVILDGQGVTTWNKSAVSNAVSRALNYPKYKYRLFKDMIYTRKHNVYFALGKDFSLKVLNREFDETCSASADLRSVLFMVFIPTRDELITGGVDGTKVWKYQQIADQTWGEIRAMANYHLTLERHDKRSEERWVRKVVLEPSLQLLFYCSDKDLIGYHMDNTLTPVINITSAHSMALTGCCYSPSARLLATCSLDCEVKTWSLTGGLVHTFRGHTKPVTDILTHPSDTSLIISSSLDGTARLWSLNTMTCIYSLVVSPDGIHHMGLTDDKLLYLGTPRTITLWLPNMVTSFWAHTRSRLTQLELISGREKSTRLLSVGDDASVRVFSRPSQKNLSTVLPPPSLSPLERMKQVTYNRTMNIVYILMTGKQLCLYTTKTDPACRMVVWNLVEIQKNVVIARDETSYAEGSQSTSRSRTESGSEQGLSVCDVCSIACLDCPAYVRSDRPPPPVQFNYLLLGLEDGRILFMDPVVKGKKYFDFKASKMSIKDMKHDRFHEMLITFSECTGERVFRFWSLPSIELLYEVMLTVPVTSYACLETSFLTGHDNGDVILHKLVSVSATVIKARRKDDEADDPSRNDNHHEHKGAVMSVDACPSRKIFLTCSVDGLLKIWSTKKTLVAEITLGATLSSACFLNKQADVVLGFHNHIFCIDHSRICPGKETKEEAECDSSDAESEIHEDPAVLFEGVRRNSDPVNMKNYLRPFNRDVIDDYVTQEEILQLYNDDASDVQFEESKPLVRASPAPTDMYRSLQSTPSRLSQIDLTLSANLQNSDVRDITNMASEKVLRFQDDKDQDGMRIEMPKFGVSPGPSPVPSPVSTPRTPSSMLCVSEGGESTDIDLDENEELAVSSGSLEDEEAGEAEATVAEEPEKTHEKPRKLVEFEHSNRAAGIVIDAAAVLQEESNKVKKTSMSKESVSHASQTASSTPPSSTQTSRASSAISRIKKKQTEGPRKLPRRKVAITATEVQPDLSDLPSPAEKPASPRKVRERRRRTKGLLDPDSDTEESPGQPTSTKAPQSYKFESRRHEIDMDSVRANMDAKPLTRPEVQAPLPQTQTLTAQTITFQDKESPTKKNKLPKGKTLKKQSSKAPQNQVRQRHTRYATRKSKSSNMVSDGGISQVADVVGDGPGRSEQRASTDSVARQGFSEEVVKLLAIKDSVRKAGMSASIGRVKSAALSEQTLRQFDSGSRTPAFLHDDDSEWALMLDDTLSRGDLTEGQRSRPSTSFAGHRRSYTPPENLKRPSRPHTANLESMFELPKNELEKNFTLELQKFRGTPGTEDFIENLYKNDGIFFDGSWHEKAITRHILLKLQRQLRAKSATEKREQVDTERMKRQTNLPGHRICNTPGQSAMPEDFKMLLRTLRERAEAGKTPAARPNTAVSQWSAGDHLNIRPHTAVSQWLDQGHSHVRANMPHFPSRDHPIAVSPHSHISEVLGAQQPYRLTLSRTSVQQGRENIYEPVDVLKLDPRHAASRAALLQPSKSIPSKCSRYILVSHADGNRDLITATPLEEQLINERFPGLRDRWLPTTDHTHKFQHRPVALDHLHKTHPHRPVTVTSNPGF